MELRKRVKVQEQEDEKSVTLNDADTDATNSASGEEPAKKKRRSMDKHAVVKKKTAVRRPRNVGKLALLLRMPIEIFTEVACYMTPGDLLNLARTSIDLRELLMSKSSKRVWEAARIVQDSRIPPCPSDLSEPQYADLLYGKGCNFCVDPRTRKTYVPIRARVCNECIDRKLTYTFHDDLVLETSAERIDLRSILPRAQVEMKAYNSRHNFLRAAVVTSRLDEVKSKIKELISDGKSVQVFIAERKAMTEAIIDSCCAIENWLKNEAHKKEVSNNELVSTRRTRIVTRLRSLGYEEEDFITRFDARGWKWNKLVNQARPLSERVWQNIRPQLEDIIKLRREHAAPQLKNIRREKRRNEIKAQFENFKPQLFAIPFGRLFSFGEFSELSLVENLTEENDCRIPVTNERWDAAIACLVEPVAESLKAFEKRCVKQITEASRPAIKGGSIATALSSLDAEVDSQLCMVDDQDEIPKCLLAATALFGSYDNDVTSYSQLLHVKSIRCTGSNPYIRWSDENKPSRELFSTAKKLMGHLKLPKDTTMSYMVARGKVFRCLTCSRISTTRSMNWLELVPHFLKENSIHARMLAIRMHDFARKTLPLRNGHDLDASRDPIVEMATKTTVDMSPTFEPAGRYSMLSSSWGCRLVNIRAEDSIVDESDGEVEEKGDETPLANKLCRLCEGLVGYRRESSRRGMRKHMKLCHGTDLDGNILPEFRETEQLCPDSSSDASSAPVAV